MKTTMGILAGKASHFVLSKLGRGSTLPGKIALKFDKDILDNSGLAVHSAILFQEAADKVKAVVSQ